VPGASPRMQDHGAHARRPRRLDGQPGRTRPARRAARGTTKKLMSSSQIDSVDTTANEHAPQAAAAAASDTFRTQHKIRLVTAASFFDGHDAAINIMRRIAQASGAEVIHLGAQPQREEIVDAADPGGRAGDRDHELSGRGTSSFSNTCTICSPSGLRARQDLRRRRRRDPADEHRGAARLRHRADLFAGRRPRLGLQGMINDLLRRATSPPVATWKNGEPRFAKRANCSPPRRRRDRPQIKQWVSHRRWLG
jgi:hypothetical protein